MKKRKEVSLTAEVIAILQQQADAVNQSLKAYMEYVLIKAANAPPLREKNQQ